MTPLPVVIDTDPGVDDAVALWYALTSSAFDVLALTAVHGNVGATLAAENALRIVHAAGRVDVPVAVGEAGPIGPAPVYGKPAWIHGADGLGETHRPLAPNRPVAEPATAVLRRIVDERPGEVTVVAIGPLSTLGRVIAEDPSWAERVRRLVVMGGSVAAGGNATAAAEANVAHDPVAADAVVGAGWTEPPLIIGLDATHAALFGEEEFALCSEHRTPAAAFCDEPLRFYRAATGRDGQCACHDLLAVLALEDSSIVSVSRLPLAVDTGEGAAWGATVADRRVGRTVQPGFAPCDVALGADGDRLRAAARTLFGG